LFETLEVRGTALDLITVPQTYYESTLGAGNEVPYLVAHGMRLARLHYEQPSIGEPRVAGRALHVLFELGDHLGSTSVVLDKETSELVQASTYQGYGAKESDYRPERWKGFREDYGFTGKEDDSEFGVVYFGKRFYSTYLNRWLTPDPLAIHIAGSADLNLYAYVRACLLRATDPIGLEDTMSAGQQCDWCEKASLKARLKLQAWQASVRQPLAGAVGTVVYLWNIGTGKTDAEAKDAMIKPMLGTAGLADLYPLPIKKGSNSPNYDTTTKPQVTALSDRRASQLVPGTQRDAVTVTDPVSGKRVAEDFKIDERGFASGLVDVTGTDAQGRDVLNAALAELGSSGKIKGFHGEWINAPGYDSNLKTFNAAIQAGYEPNKAATLTFTGKVLASDHGMTDARVDLNTSKRNADGSFRIVDVYFTAPKAPPKAAR